jgi:hypothetical protein
MYRVYQCPKRREWRGNDDDDDDVYKITTSRILQTQREGRNRTNSRGG